MSAPQVHPKEYKRLLVERAAGLERFAKWEAKQSLKMSPVQVLAAIGTIYSMVPPEFRKKDLDSKLKGIIAMRKALAVLK